MYQQITWIMLLLIAFESLEHLNGLPTCHIISMVGEVNLLLSNDFLCFRRSDGYIWWSVYTQYTVRFNCRVLFEKLKLRERSLWVNAVTPSTLSSVTRECHLVSSKNLNLCVTFHLHLWCKSSDKHIIDGNECKHIVYKWDIETPDDRWNIASGACIYPLNESKWTWIQIIRQSFFDRTGTPLDSHSYVCGCVRTNHLSHSKQLFVVVKQRRSSDKNRISSSIQS